MRKKLIGILVLMLMIATTVLPVVGIRNNYKSTNVDESIIETEQQGSREEDYDWQRSGNNVFTGHGGSYPSGNVGIGTTSPSSLLHIKGNTPNIRLEESDQSNKLWNIAGYNSGLAFSEANVGDWLYISEGGNVGIRTTSPSEELHISNEDGCTAVRLVETTGTASVWELQAYHNEGYSNFAIWGGESGSEKTWIRCLPDIVEFNCFAINIGDNYIYDLSDPNPFLIQSSVDKGIELMADKDIRLIPTYGTEGIYIDLSGNVGIGTTEPSYLLDVSGDNGIVAQFSGRVKGAQAVNNDEFVTKAQVNSRLTSCYTPTGSNDINGDIGDTAWDNDYFYVKTPDGWKRAALETW